MTLTRSAEAVSHMGFSSVEYPTTSVRERKREKMKKNSETTCRTAGTRKHARMSAMEASRAKAQGARVKIG